MSAGADMTMSWARYIVNTAIAAPGQDVAYGLLVRQTSEAHVSQFAGAVEVASAQVVETQRVLQEEIARWTR